MVVPFWRCANHQPGGLADRSDVSEPRVTERGGREVEWPGRSEAHVPIQVLSPLSLSLVKLDDLPAASLGPPRRPDIVFQG